LTNLNNPGSVKSVEQLGVSSGTYLVDVAHAKGVQLRLASATTPSEIDTAVATLAELKVDGLVVGPDPLFYKSHDQIVALAARYRIPAIYDHRLYTEAGGLISYGAKDMSRAAGVYAGRILAGAKPADLPVQQPTKFETIINLKAAKALGLVVPPSILARADEIIE
jgi:putative ABC transport system substrate-binding protein